MFTNLPRALCLAGLMLHVIVLFTTGCGRTTPLSPDQKVAAREVAKLVPPGTTEARARRVLGDRGFTLSRLSTDHATNHLIIATYTKGDLMWQVGLIIVDARVAATSVTVTDFSVVSR
jgi:hypothetical protein